MKSHAETVERFLDLPSLLRNKSHFLLGPRQTGKTFLLRRTLDNVRTYDLLDTSTAGIRRILSSTGDCRRGSHTQYSGVQPLSRSGSDLQRYDRKLHQHRK